MLLSKSPPLFQVGDCKRYITIWRDDYYNLTQWVPLNDATQVRIIILQVPKTFVPIRKAWNNYFASTLKKDTFRKKGIHISTVPNIQLNENMNTQNYILMSIPNKFQIKRYIAQVSKEKEYIPNVIKCQMSLNFIYVRQNSLNLII